LLIQFFLFPVSWAEGDNAKFIPVVAGVLHDESGFSLEFRDKPKGQAESAPHALIGPKPGGSIETSQGDASIRRSCVR
jgi:hypothetical protein